MRTELTRTVRETGVVELYEARNNSNNANFTMKDARDLLITKVNGEKDLLFNNGKARHLWLKVKLTYMWRVRTEDMREEDLDGADQDRGTMLYVQKEKKLHPYDVIRCVLCSLYKLRNRHCYMRSMVSTLRLAHSLSFSIRAHLREFNSAQLLQWEKGLCKYVSLMHVADDS